LKDLVVPKLYFQEEATGLVQLYYLPWEGNKRFTLDLGNDATYFMTASMHGCRFEIHQKANGTLHVSHSNVQGSNTIADPQALLPYMRRADVNRGTRQVKFGKTTYFADAQKLIGSAQQRLMDWNVAPEDVLEASPEAYKANVLGERANGGAWTFYYQLWGLLKVRLHERVKVKKWLGLKTEYDENTREAYLKVVFLVKELYPNERTIFKLHKRATD
jgi:hypothetical protein